MTNEEFLNNKFCMSKYATMQDLLADKVSYLLRQVDWTQKYMCDTYLLISAGGSCLLEAIENAQKEMSNYTEQQAFPRQQWEYDEQGSVLPYQEPGMTLRDYFAAKVVAGILSNYEGSVGVNHPVETLNLAKAAYAVADAMMKARENNNG